MPPAAKSQDELNVALCDAAQANDTAKIREALALGADAHAQDDYALCHAASSGSIEAMRMLLAAGADANACQGRPLRYAAFDGNLEALKLLLEVNLGERKADVNAADSYGDTALAAAAQRGHVEAVNLLLEAGAHVTGSGAVARASAMGHSETMKLLIAAEGKEREFAPAIPPNIPAKAEAVAVASVRRPVAAKPRKPRGPGMG